VATTCTLGSLYLSEVAKFPPCELCWFQRIAMYPLVVVLGIAALRRDTSVRRYAVPLAGIGLAVSIYHYLVERFPDSITTSCTTDVPCSTVWVWKFHFLSIPAMAGAGFALIIVLVLLATSTGSGTERPSTDDSLTDRTTDRDPSEELQA
jgi:disulfide bond formation protein DsbB